MGWLWLAVLALLPVLDSVYRMGLLVCSWGWRPRQRPTEDLDSFLLLIPARAEGAAVEPTLRSVMAGIGEANVEAVLLLDGEDPEAAAVAESCGVQWTCKTPPGPSKGAALGWAAETMREKIEAAGAVFVLDIGSTLSEGFFDIFDWVEGADGVQAFLSGTGSGPGTTAALSEQIAQRHEDCGREVLGWSVRLRGTGFALRPASFLDLAPRLKTQVEDTEMSLLLVERGARLVMGPKDAVVYDEKPERVADAARQRARWLAGQLALPLQRAGTLLKVMLRRPLQGLGFVAEIAGRPLSLTVPLRLVIAAVLGWHAGPRELLSPEGIAAAVIAASAVFDVLLNALSTGFRLPSAVYLMFSWLRAIALLPKAFFGWMWTRRER